MDKTNFYLDLSDQNIWLVKSNNGFRKEFNSKEEAQKYIDMDKTKEEILILAFKGYHPSQYSDLNEIQKGRIFQAMEEYGKQQHSKGFEEGKKIKAENKKLKSVLEFAAQELRNTGCGENEWMGRLLKKIDKVL